MSDKKTPRLPKSTQTNTQTNTQTQHNYRPGFRTIQNGGSQDGFSNQCMFISILHYLMYVRLDHTVTLSGLRRIAGLDSTTSHTMFDIDDPRFVEGIRRICDHFNIQINVHYSNRNGTRNMLWLGNPAWTAGNSNEIVPIVAYGNHFELIVSRDITGELPIVPGDSDLTIREFTPVINKTVCKSVCESKETSTESSTSTDLSSSSIESSLVNNTKSKKRKLNKRERKREKTQLTNMLLLNIIDSRDIIKILGNDILETNRKISHYQDEIRSRRCMLENIGTCKPTGTNIDDLRNIINTEIKSLEDLISEYNEEIENKNMFINELRENIQTNTVKLNSMLEK